MNKGFTLFELIIVIAITAIISTLILANFPKFSRNLELSRTAQAVALSFREAESAALAVREVEGQFPAYGLHFEKGDPDNRSYFLFADLNDDDGDGIPEGNGEYDGPADTCGGECVDEFRISGFSYISDLCVRVNLGQEKCELDDLDVVFKRPLPEVTIHSTDAADVIPYNNAKIIIERPGVTRKMQVVIWTTGQLSVEPSE